MSTFDMSAYLGVFLDEVDEQLQILDEEILKLEQNGEDIETIQRIFRAAHTLKGSSATMGFENMKELTHKMENVFDLIRNQQLTVTTTLINVIFDCIDYLKVLKEAIVNGSLEQTDIQPLVEKLEQIKSGAASTEQQPSAPIQQSPTSSSDSDPIVQFDDYQKEIIRQALATEYKVMVVYIRLVEDSIMKSVRAMLIYNNLRETGEVIASFPTAEEIENEEMFAGSLVYILVTKQSKQEIIHVINHISEIKTVNISMLTEANLDSFSEGKKIQVIETISREEVAPVAKAESKIKVNQTVRVDVERLEELMNFVGELVIDQTRLVDIKNKLNNRYEDEGEDEDVRMLGEVTNHLGRIVSELQAGMMKTRMLPIEQLFNRFPRMVRDLAQKSNKEVDFIMEGKETELDRTLIEEIGDPIIHLIRNSMDHGLEEPEGRKQAGKPLKGRLVLKAAHEENHIVITVSDDGRGIDPQKIKASAIKKGLVTQEEADKMSDKELVFLIFKSGVSTAAKVTDISGRGVGMDIVRSHIEKLNGVIDIETSPGEGTTFIFKLPLTLAIIRSLLVRLGSKTFAIPLINVLEIVRLRSEEVKTIKNREVGVVRGMVLPLVRMHSRLGIREEEGDDAKSRKRLFVVVIGLAEKRVGLVVNETIGNQEIVIKSLGKYLGTPPYLAGATIMGNGEVALILDAGSVIREEGTREISPDIKQKKEQEQENMEQQLVTFMLGAEEYGVPIDQVKDIIMVPKISSVMTAPFAVLGMINLRGKVIPVVDLRRRFGLFEGERTRKSRIIVVESRDQEIGMLVDQVTEVVKISKKTIEAPPENVSQVDAKFIRGICNLPERLITLLHIDFNDVLEKE